MVKFITKSVCMALIAMLCVGSLGAQQVRKSDQQINANPKLQSFAAKTPLVFAAKTQRAPATRAVVYSEGFEGTTGTALPTGWTTAGGTWVTLSNADYWSEPVGHCGDPFDPHSGTRMMGREWYNSGNYWVFSNSFSLAAGEVYEVTFWFSAPGWPDFNESDNFEVKIGQTASAGGMTNLIYERLNNNTAPYPYDWTKATGTFTPTTAGTYYLGIHDLNPAQTGLWILIDDIEVSGGGTGGDTYTITTEVSPAGAGSVTGGGTYPEGATVTLTAIANTGYDFQKWNTESTANPLVFTATENATYTAYFVAAGACDPPTNLEVAYEPDCSMATLTWDAASKGRAGVIHDNGPFITHPGQGAGGLDVAAFGTSGETLYGSNAGHANGFAMADDFILSTPVEIETIEFYTYQTGSGTTTNPITAIYVEILDGPPNAGGTVVWGDETTNRLVSSVFSNAYRVSSTLTDTQRPLWKVTAAVEVALDPGTYWLLISYTGNAAYTGPWANPVTILNEVQTGNGLQRTSTGVWQNWINWDDVNQVGNQAPLDLPFVIYGEGGTQPEDPEYNIYRDGLLIGGPTTETTFEDTDFDPNAAHIWSVAVACANGGDGEWVNVEEDACVPPGPEPCDPITGGTATIDCTTADLTWTAVAGAVGYKVTRDGTTTTVTEPTYTETGEFEDGVSYTWTIVTVCDEDESDSIAITGVANCVGIPELANNVSIYPNPTSGMITISALNFAKVEIYNTVGQLMETRTDQYFDVASYNTGIYFFKVYDLYNNSVTKRVMVTK